MIDKRITPRWIAYERADTVIGALVVVVGAAAIMLAAAAALHGTREFGNFTDVLGTARGRTRHVGTYLGAIFAVLLLDASVIGASAVTMATPYAFGDVFNLHHSLHRGFGEAKAFYGSYTAMVALAAAIVLIPNAPLGLIRDHGPGGGRRGTVDPAKSPPAGGHGDLHVRSSCWS